MLLPPLADVGNQEAAAQARIRRVRSVSGVEVCCWVGALGGCLRGWRWGFVLAAASWLPHRSLLDRGGSFSSELEFGICLFASLAIAIRFCDQFIQRRFQRRRELPRRVETRQGQSALDLADRRAVRRGPEGELVLAHVRCTASLGEVDPEAASELLASRLTRCPTATSPPRGSR